MKITKIRTKKSEIPSTDLILDIERELKFRLSKAGFITGVVAQTRTSIKIGQHRRSFSLDLSKHDRNLYVSQSGDKLTNLPTWDQRVEFNNIVNAVLNKFKVSANVKSGFYTIRKGFECMTEYDWQDQKPRWIYHNEINGNYIESVDEKQYLEDRRLKRLELARQKRSEAKLQNQEDGALSF